MRMISVRQLDERICDSTAATDKLANKVGFDSNQGSEFITDCEKVLKEIELGKINVWYPICD